MSSFAVRHRPIRGLNDDTMQQEVYCASTEHRKEWVWPCPMGKFVLLNGPERALADWWAKVDSDATLSSNGPLRGSDSVVGDPA